MFFTNINLKPNTFKGIAITTTVIGMIFILAANHIGNFAIRFAMVVAAIVCAVNLKMTYHYAGKLKKITDILCLVGAIVVFIFPQLVVFILGIAILYFSGAELFQMIKDKDYSDKIKLVASIIGVVFSIFCIFNAQGTLVLFIRLIGTLLLGIGCICFYQFITKSRQKQEDFDDYKFESADEIQDIKDIKEEE